MPSCVDTDWYWGLDADDRVYLHGMASIQKLSEQKDGPELGSGQLKVHQDAALFALHLSAHFFNVLLTNDGTRQVAQVFPTQISIIPTP